MVMWVIGLWMAKARPWARGFHRFRVGPSFAWASTITRSSAARLWLFSAFAVALARTRATSRAAPCGSNPRVPLLYMSGLPRFEDGGDVGLRLVDGKAACPGS